MLALDTTEHANATGIAIPRCQGMLPELIAALRRRTLILFVGGGVSMNLGTPSFDELVAHLAGELQFDAGEFAQYGDYRALAEYYQLATGTLAPIKQWIDRAWHGHDIAASEIHRLIVELDVPILYTTNYDTWLERAYDLYKKPYVKVAKSIDLARIEPNVTQIVKLHGDCSDDTPMVLTESSFFERLDFEEPLDVKLRADLLGRSVLFIGYSLSDLNIRYMLFKLQRQWQASSFEHARPKSFIFLAEPNPVQQRVLQSRGLQVIVSTHDEPGTGLRNFLQELREQAGRAEHAAATTSTANNPRPPSVPT